MATILLGNIGTAVGGIFGPAGALIGRALGSLAGAAIDGALVSALTPAQRIEGPRLTTTDIQTGTEGTGITRLYGRARTAGQLIWATRFEEVIDTERSGGKGSQPKVETTTYSYYANFAVGLVEGPIAGIGRMFADGEELDLTEIEFRLYTGTTMQLPDPLIEAKEGTAPAYRNLAYIVFERFALASHGNRIPQISVEVYRPTGALESMVDGVALIPGNEFGLATTEVRDGEGVSENRHDLTAATDFVSSIDRLTALCPGLQSVMLVVSWFGDDLRCGECRIRPKTVSAEKTTEPLSWRVGGLSRANAMPVSVIAGIPAYGGTPSDATVIDAISHLKARGLAVTYCPFIMMDIVGGNGLPDPYGGAEQPQLPWRGRITCHPAPGRPGSPDRSAEAAAQVATFAGSANAGDFSIDGQSVSYHGADEWGFRRFILQNAALAAAAGGVDTFLIGSEMAGMSPVRSGPATYPFVGVLTELAAECRALLGAGPVIGYAADWSEWLNHRPDDGSGDVLFHLDPLWAHPDIDFVGIDCYFPLADWRDGSAHRDFAAEGPTSIYDQAYLRANIEGGEYYDWYYAGTTARIDQDRTPIADGDDAGEPWIYRNKDIRSWWLSAHHDRPGGMRSATATAWQPMMKPVRLIEYGCPAVDKGANQPNLFPDPRSAEGAYPWFSNRARDDGMQRAYLQALIGHWSESAVNPVSPVYGGRMIDLGRSHAWCWDTRPWPSFAQDGLWGDAANWLTGHWLSGRLGSAPAEETIGAILADAGFADHRIDPLPRVVDGVTSNGVQSPRALLDALRPVLGFDAVETDGVIRFRDRHAAAPLAVIDGDILVAGEGGISAWRRTLAQEGELPAAIRLSHGDPARNDQQATAEARRATSAGRRTVTLSAPAVLPADQARAVAELELAAEWTAREQVTMTLPPSLGRLDPGDVVTFGPTGRLMRLAEIEDGDARQVTAAEVDPAGAASVRTSPARGPAVARPPTIAPQILLVDGPLLRDGDLDHAGYLAGFTSPFGYGVSAWRSPEETGYVRDSLIDRPATTGVTVEPFYSGPLWRFDRVSRLAVKLARGALTSATEAALFDGANPVLVENADGEWELVQFLEAELRAPQTWLLTGLLRGQKGSEHAMRDPVAPGARVLIADAGLRQTTLTPDHLGLPLNWRAGPASLDISAAGPAVAVTMKGKARRPLSPAQLKGRASGGDVILSWIRRGRLSADSWEQVEIPLGEEREAYEVEILAGSTVRRTFGTTEEQVIYTASERVADGVAIPFDFIVYQMSATYGRGIGARNSFYG